MLESLRIISFVHHAVPHHESVYIEVGEYVIPKGSGVFPSLISIMYDPIHFPKPHDFKPEWFLDDNVKYETHDHVIEFGVGKRCCWGKALAEKEFFLFLVRILQKFDMTPAPDPEIPCYNIDYKPTANIVRGCPPYEMILSFRI